jgi:hypothetical protein
MTVISLLYNTSASEAQRPTRRAASGMSLLVLRLQSQIIRMVSLPPLMTALMEEDGEAKVCLYSYSRREQDVSRMDVSGR